MFVTGTYGKLDSLQISTFVKHLYTYSPAAEQARSEFEMIRYAWLFDSISANGVAVDIRDIIELRPNHTGRFNIKSGVG